MCGFQMGLGGCCGCDCDPVFLTLNDGVSWVPTADMAETSPGTYSVIELVSSKDVFCKGPETPFYFGFNIENLTYAGLGDSVIRLMARVESTEADDLAVIGDHCFAEIRRSDDLVGVTSLSTQPAIWVRIGVCIDGVDTILHSGTAIVSLKVLGFRLGIKFGSGLASSTGQIKLASATNLPLTTIASSPNFREGDYFLARAAITLTGSPSNLAAAKGKLYRLADAAHAGDPASWIESPLSELDDPYLYCGSGDYNPATLVSTGTSIYQSDAAEAFGSLPGRKLAVRISNAGPGVPLYAADVWINNAISPKSLACPFTEPSRQDAPVGRVTPLPVYTGSITGAVTGIIYPGWATKVSGSFVTVYPDMPYLGSGPAESIKPPSATQGIIRQTSFCKYGPIVNDAVTPTNYYLYAQITADIKITWTQTPERKFRYRVDADVTYRVDRSVTDWTLAELLAGDHDMSFGYRDDTTHAGHADTGDINVDSHLTADMTTTLDPTPTGPAGTNRDRLDVFELTLNVPVPQP